MLEKEGDVKNKALAVRFRPPFWHFGASNDVWQRSFRRLAKSKNAPPRPGLPTS